MTPTTLHNLARIFCGSLLLPAALIVAGMLGEIVL
jgi:hypothetical protein